jgi:hypothetical protein
VPSSPYGPGRTMPHNSRSLNGAQVPPTSPNQSTLPPNPPTSAPSPAPNTLPSPIAATSDGRTATRPQRAVVSYEDGRIDVRANDSSLNQILRAISRATGMTITGGVADQRVFGNYGPASPSAVLATLLDGTGTNMLLREGDDATPPELVLTPRGGGPSPPSPSAVPDESVADAPPVAAPIASPAASAASVNNAASQSTVVPASSAPTQPGTVTPVNGVLPLGNPIPANNVNGSQYNVTPTASQLPTTNSVPLDTLAHPSTTPSVSGIVDSPNPPSGATPAPGTTTTAAPGQLTPEQVYQQLLQMQQKQAQPQPAQQSAPATTTPPQ